MPEYSGMSPDKILVPGLPMGRIWILYGHALDTMKRIRGELLGGSPEDAEEEFDDPDYIAASVIPPKWKLDRMGKTPNEWLTEHDYDPISKEILEKHGYG